MILPVLAENIALPGRIMHIQVDSQDTNQVTYRYGIFIRPKGNLCPWYEVCCSDWVSLIVKVSLKSGMFVQFIMWRKNGGSQELMPGLLSTVGRTVGRALIAVQCHGQLWSLASSKSGGQLYEGHLTMALSYMALQKDLQNDRLLLLAYVFLATWLGTQLKGLDNQLKDFNWLVLHRHLPVRSTLYDPNLTLNKCCICQGPVYN
jgi:hypothetical protein